MSILWCQRAIEVNNTGRLNLNDTPVSLVRRIHAASQLEIPKDIDKQMSQAGSLLEPRFNIPKGRLDNMGERSLCD